ncbi:ABC transporter permease [Aquihabitans sp. G128]|uniref:MlaE family ABC transporter permease n=1 Tax=Aquihabitans sp. G128 TaxID=2849779 RepID=UPI001C22C51F|nr:ABC transporter permease [Aquihabitans sp. G128]QXC61950.1 ABC transporter permease [Aquihabitans sp. G128]
MAMVIPGASKVGNVVREVGAMAAVGIEAVRKVFSRPWPLAEFLDQCWFIAKVTTVPVILISIPFGMVISLQVGALIRQLGADAHLGSALVLAVVREQAPIATALLIAGAGGSAMCADIGSRKIRDELAAMEVMSINPIQRVVMPRVLAATVIAVLLDAVVSAAGLAGGWFFATQVLGVSSSSFFASFNELSQLPDLWMALLKAGIFGFIAGVVACYKGLSCKGGPKGVGDAVNQAVVITFVLLFFVNFVLTAIYFNFVPQKI